LRRQCHSEDLVEVGGRVGVDEQHPPANE
jgi:hypothetical protein